MGGIAMNSFLIKGTLKGFDQTVNLILSGSHERVYSSGAGVEVVQLGLYIIRGDNMYKDWGEGGAGKLKNCIFLVEL